MPCWLLKSLPQTTPPIREKLVLCLIAQTSPAFYLGDVAQITSIIYRGCLWCCYQEKKKERRYNASTALLRCWGGTWLCKTAICITGQPRLGWKPVGCIPTRPISMSRTFLCPSVFPATCREAVMCNGEVTRGIASGQLHFPASPPRLKQFRFNSILKKY